VIVKLITRRSANHKSVQRLTTRIVHLATIAIHNIPCAVELVQPEDEPNDKRSARKRICKRYLDLGESAAIIVREMKKTPNPEVRRKLTHELRNADKKRIEILNQIDGLLG
jgi:hypothetical protein